MTKARLDDLPTQPLPPSAPAAAETGQVKRKTPRRPRPIRNLVLLAVALLVTTGTSLGLAAAHSDEPNALLGATAVATAISVWFVAALMLLLVGRK